MSNIKVAVRVRPENSKEQQRNANIIVNVQNNVVQIHNSKLERQAEGFADSRERIKSFSFDYAYNSVDPSAPGYASQQLIFQDLGNDVLQQSFDGFNTCVFAYGQTGSGKSYTMMGYPPNEVGLIPRLCESLFTRIHDACEEVEEEQRVSFNVSVSYLEIYNESVRDLLTNSLSRSEERYTLKVREHPKDGPFVENLSKHAVKDNKTMQAFIKQGNEVRTTAATHYHDRSSRSHAIFTVTFTQSKYDEVSQLPSEKVSKINLVDLAGSERADPNSHYNKGRLKEGANINKSLVTLGNVIQSLAERSLLEWSQRQDSMLGSTQSLNSPDGSRESLNTSAGKAKLHIPYRDSILTWLLKDSLGGNSKTIMIATVSPSDLYYRETLSTLRYAQRAKSIVNKPVVNEDANVALIRELKEEVGRLKVLLAAKWAGSMTNVSETSSCIAEKMEDYEDRAKELTNLWLLDRWQETQEIMKDPYFKMHLKRVSKRSHSLPGHVSDDRTSRESDMSINPVHLGRRSSSMGVIVDSHLPHLIGIDDDVLSTGVVMYHLKEGKTQVGNEDGGKDLDIYLTGEDILNEHCVIRHIHGEVMLHPNQGAHVKVNNRDITQPVQLSQGDVIFLGRSNMFRFNNPMQAAKLRESRKAKYGDTRLPGALSRWSSLGSMPTHSSSEYETIGGSLPASPVIKRGVDMERSYNTEEEKIQKARDDIEQFEEEERKAKETLLEKEEEMWRLHERHKMELEAEKEELRRRIHEFEEERTQAELDLEERRRQLDEDSAEREAELAAKQAYIKELEQRHQEEITRSTQDFPIATMPDLGSLALQTESQMKYAMHGGLSAESQKLEDLRAKLQKEEEKLMKSRLDDQEHLKQKEMELEELFLTQSEKLELEKRRLKDKEKNYRDHDAAILKSMSVQTDFIEQLEHKKVQLVQYIEAKEQDLEEDDGIVRGSPVGASSSHSTGSLHSSPRTSRRTTKPSSLSLSALNTDHSRFSHSDSVPSPKPPLSPSPSKKEAKPKVKTSITAQKVTDRLYNAEKIKQQALASGIKFHEVSKRTKPPIYKSGARPKQRRLQHTNSSSSLASVPETVDEEEESKTVAGLHIANYDKDPVRLRNKPHLRGDNRPHSWAAADSVGNRRVMVIPKLENALQEGSTESLSNMEYIDADASGQNLLQSDSESGLDPALEERLGPEGKERTDSLTSCKRLLVPSDIPDISVRMLTDQQQHTSLPMDHQSETFQHLHPNDLQVQRFMETNESDIVKAPASPKQQKSSTSSPATTRKGKKSNTVKMPSPSESPPIKKKRPKSATSHDKQQPFSRPRTSSSTSVHSQSDLSPRLVKSTKTSSYKNLNPGKKTSSSRASSVGSISPQASPKIKRKSEKMGASSPQSKSKMDKKKGTSSPSKENIGAHGVEKRPLNDNDAKTSDCDATKKLKSVEALEAGVSLGSVFEDCHGFPEGGTQTLIDNEASKDTDVNNTLVSDGTILTGDQNSKATNAVVDEVDGQMISVKKIGKRKKHPKTSFDGLSTQELQTQYTALINRKLAKEEKLKQNVCLDTQSLQEDYLRMLVQQLKDEEEGSSNFSDDSLDNLDIDNFDSVATENQRDLVPATKKSKLEKPQESSTKTSIPFSAGQTPDDSNTASSVPQPLPCHEEGHDPSIYSVPTVDLTKAILQSQPVLQYYFKSSSSKSDTEVCNTKTAEHPENKSLSQRPKSAGAAETRKVSKDVISCQESFHPKNQDSISQNITTSPQVDQGIPQTESSLRKNCKYRASRKRQQEQPTESESGQQSDDSLHSGVKIKLNGRPSPATRRRRRLLRKDRTQGRAKLGMSSEEYVTSEDGESSFSEDSLHSEDRQDPLGAPLAKEARQVVDKLTSMTSLLQGSDLNTGTDEISRIETTSENQNDAKEALSLIEETVNVVLPEENSNPSDDKVSNVHMEEMSGDELNKSLNSVTDMDLSVEVTTAEAGKEKSDRNSAAVSGKVSALANKDASDLHENKKEDPTKIKESVTHINQETDETKSLQEISPASSGTSGGQNGSEHDSDGFILNTKEMETALYASGAASLPDTDDSEDDSLEENNLDSVSDAVDDKGERIRGDGVDSNVSGQDCNESSQEGQYTSEMQQEVTEETPRDDIDEDIDNEEDAGTEDRHEPKLSIREYVHNISIPSSLKTRKKKKLSLTVIQSWDNYNSLAAHTESSSFDENQPDTSLSEQPEEDETLHYDVVSLLGSEAERVQANQTSSDELKLEFEVLPGRPITKDFVIAKLQNLKAGDGERSPKKKPLSRHNSDKVLSDSSKDSEYTCKILSRVPGVTAVSPDEQEHDSQLDVTSSESAENDNQSIYSGDSLDETSDVDMNEEGNKRLIDAPHDPHSEFSVDTDSLYQDSVSESAMDTDSIDVGGPLSENEIRSRESSPEKAIETLNVVPKGGTSEYLAKDNDQPGSFNASERKVNFIVMPEDSSEKSVITSEFLGEVLGHSLDFNERKVSFVEKPEDLSKNSGITSELLGETLGQKDREDRPQVEATVGHVTATDSLEPEEIVQRSVTKAVGVDGDDKPLGGTRNNRDSGYYSASRDSCGYQFASASESESDTFDQSRSKFTPGSPREEERFYKGVKEGESADIASTPSDHLTITCSQYSWETSENRHKEDMLSSPLRNDESSFVNDPFPSGNDNYKQGRFMPEVDEAIDENMDSDVSLSDKDSKSASENNESLKAKTTEEIAQTGIEGHETETLADEKTHKIRQKTEETLGTEAFGIDGDVPQSDDLMENESPRLEHKDEDPSTANSDSKCASQDEHSTVKIVSNNLDSTGSNKNPVTNSAAVTAGVKVNGHDQLNGSDETTEILVTAEHHRKDETIDETSIGAAEISSVNADVQDQSSISATRTVVHDGDILPPDDLLDEDIQRVEQRDEEPLAADKEVVQVEVTQESKSETVSQDEHSRVNPELNNTESNDVTVETLDITADVKVNEPQHPDHTDETREGMLGTNERHIKNEPTDNTSEGAAEISTIDAGVQDQSFMVCQGTKDGIVSDKEIAVPEENQTRASEGTAEPQHRESQSQTMTCDNVTDKLHIAVNEDLSAVRDSTNSNSATTEFLPPQIHDTPTQSEEQRDSKEAITDGLCSVQIETSDNQLMVIQDSGEINKPESRDSEIDSAVSDNEDDSGSIGPEMTNYEHALNVKDLEEMATTESEDTEIKTDHIEPPVLETEKPSVEDSRSIDPEMTNSGLTPTREDKETMDNSEMTQMPKEQEVMSASEMTQSSKDQEVTDNFERTETQKDQEAVTDSEITQTPTDQEAMYDSEMTITPIDQKAMGDSEVTQPQKDQEAMGDSEMTQPQKDQEAMGDSEMTQPQKDQEAMGDSEMTQPQKDQEAMGDSEMTQPQKDQEAMGDSEMTQPQKDQEAMGDSEMTQPQKDQEAMGDSEVTHPQKDQELMADSELFPTPSDQEAIGISEVTQTPKDQEALRNSEKTQTVKDQEVMGESEQTQAQKEQEVMVDPELTHTQKDHEMFGNSKLTLTVKDQEVMGESELTQTQKEQEVMVDPEWTHTQKDHEMFGNSKLTLTVKDQEVMGESELTQTQKEQEVMVDPELTHTQKGHEKFANAKLTLTVKDQEAMGDFELTQSQIGQEVMDNSELILTVKEQEEMVDSEMTQTPEDQEVMSNSEQVTTVKDQKAISNSEQTLTMEDQKAVSNSELKQTPEEKEVMGKSQVTRTVKDQKAMDTTDSANTENNNDYVKPTIMETKKDSDKTSIRNVDEEVHLLPTDTQDMLDSDEMDTEVVIDSIQPRDLEPSLEHDDSDSTNVSMESDKHLTFPDDRTSTASNDTSVRDDLAMDVDEESQESQNVTNSSDAQKQKVMDAVRQINDIFDQAGQHIKSGQTESEGSLSVDEDSKDQVDSREITEEMQDTSLYNPEVAINQHYLAVQNESLSTISPAVSDCDILYENIVLKEGTLHEDFVSDQSGSVLSEETENQYTISGSCEETPSHSEFSYANQLEREKNNRKPGGTEKHSGEQENLNRDNTLKDSEPKENVEKVPKSENVLGQQSYVDRELEFSVIDQSPIKDIAEGRDNNTIKSITDPLSGNGSVDISIEPPRQEPECLPEEERANFQSDSPVEVNIEEKAAQDDTLHQVITTDKLSDENKLLSSVVEVDKQQFEAVGLESNQVCSSESNSRISTDVNEHGYEHNTEENVTEIPNVQEFEPVNVASEEIGLLPDERVKTLEEDSELEKKDSSEKSANEENKLTSVFSDPECNGQDITNASSVEETEQVLHANEQCVSGEITNKHKRDTQTDNYFEDTGNSTEDKPVDKSFNLSGDITEIVSSEEHNQYKCESNGETKRVKELNEQCKESLQSQEVDDSDNYVTSDNTQEIVSTKEVTEDTGNEATEKLSQSTEEYVDTDKSDGLGHTNAAELDIGQGGETDMDTNGVNSQHDAEETVDVAGKSGSKCEISEMEVDDLDGATNTDDVQEESKGIAEKPESSSDASHSQENGLDNSVSSEPSLRPGESNPSGVVTDGQRGVNGHSETPAARDSRPQGAVGGSVTPRQSKTDQFTDGMFSLSTDTSFDEGYTTMLGSPRSESVDDVLRHSRYTSENDTQSLENPTSPPFVPRLDLNSLLDNGDSTSDIDGPSQRRSNDRGELQDESRSVDVLEAADPRYDQDRDESVHKTPESNVSVNLVHTNESLVNRPMEDMEMGEYNVQYDTPPRSPPGTPSHSPRQTAPERILSESDIMQGQLASNMQSGSGTLSQNLTKSDLYLQPAKDSDKDLFADSAEGVNDEERSSAEDLGSFELVHYKEPEPNSRKRKKQKVDKSEKAKQLTQSETNTLTNDDIDQLEEQFHHEGNSYTTIRDTPNTTGPDDAAGILQNEQRRPLRKEMSVVVNVDDNEEKDEIDESEIEYIRNESKRASEDGKVESDNMEDELDQAEGLNVNEILQNAGPKPLNREVSVTVNVDDNESTPDIDEQEIEYIRKGEDDEDQTSDTKEKQHQQIQRHGSLVVNVGELDNISEDELVLLKQQGGDIAEETKDVIVTESENAVPPDVDLVLRRNDASVIVNIDENERNEITEEDIQTLTNDSVRQSQENDVINNSDELVILPDQEGNVSSMQLSQDPSLVVQIDENEKQDQITEEEIELMKENKQAESDEEDVISDRNGVGFFIGGDMPQSEFVNQNESNTYVNQFMEKVKQEREKLKGSQDNKPQSDSAFSSDYTDPTHSDLTDSELSPIHRHYGHTNTNIQDSQNINTEAQGTALEESQKDASVPSSNARIEEGAEEDVHFVSLGEHGRAESIEEIQQLPSPRTETGSTKPQKDAVFRDTKVIGFDMCYSDTRPGSPGVPITEGHQIVTGTQSTISVSGNCRKSKPYSEMQVLGLQPTTISSPSETQEMEVLIDEPPHPFQHNLTHTSLNIEIRPWKEHEQSMNINRDNYSNAYMLIPGSSEESDTQTDYKSKSKGWMHSKTQSETIQTQSDSEDDNAAEEGKCTTDTRSSAETAVENKDCTDPDTVKDDDLGFNVEIVDSEPEDVSFEQVQPKQKNSQSSEGQNEIGISKSQPEMDRCKGADGASPVVPKAVVRVGLTSDQRKIGEITDSARELLGSDQKLFEGLVPSFPDLQETIESSSSVQDDSISKRMSKSMDDSMMTSSDSHLLQRIEDSGDDTDEDQLADREHKLKMFQDAGKMLFDQEETYSPSLLSEDAKSDISDIQLINSDIMDLEEGEYESGSDRSPGELRMPMSRDTLASSTSSLTSDIAKNEACDWPEIVSHLPEMMTDSLKDIRDNYMRRYHQNLRSFSMSELEYIEPRDWYDGVSLSLDCVHLNIPPARTVSNDSITYVFVTPARSLDTWTQDFESASRAPQMVSASSEPSCSEKEMRHKYGIDEDILPFKNKTQSVEDISEGTAQVAMSTRQRSQSIDESRLLASESKRSQSPDLTPETVFGGIIQTDDHLTLKPPIPEFVQPRPGDEPVKLRRRRNWTENPKRVSWGDVEEKLDTYHASPDRGMSNQYDTTVETPVLVEMGVQTSGSLEDIQNQGGIMRMIQDNATGNGDESHSSQTNADTVLSNHHDQSNSLVSMSSEVTDAQTSPIPFDSISYEINSSVQRHITSDIELSEPSSLIQEALQKLRTAMGSQTDISVVDSQNIPPGTPLRVHHYTTEITQTPDEMMYPPKEGPLSVSSPREEDDQRYRSDSKAKPYAARQLLTGNEGYISEQLQNVEDMTTPGMHQRQGTVVMQPPIDEAFVDEVASNRPPQPVGRARPMPGRFSEGDNLTSDKLTEEELMHSRPDSHQYGLPFSYAPHFITRLPSEYPRTIETQTWPDIRVIETQTYQENRLIETQTSPHFFNETDCTQTDNIETLPIAVQTEEPDWSLQRPPVCTIETGCNPSPPRGFSPIELAAKTDVSIFNMYDDRFSQTDTWNDYLEAEIQKALLREQQENVKTDEKEVESVGIQAGSPHLEDIASEPTQPEPDRSRSPMWMTSNISRDEVPIFTFNDPSLTSLRAEHEKLMQLFSKSKDDRESSIAKRKKLKEKKREEILNELEQSMSESMYSSTTDLESLHDIQAGAPEFINNQDISVRQDLNIITDQNTQQVELSKVEVSVSHSNESEIEKIEGFSVRKDSKSEVSNVGDSSDEQPASDGEEVSVEVEPVEVAESTNETDLYSVSGESVSKEQSDVRCEIETDDPEGRKAVAIEELVMSDEFFFTIKESTGGDAGTEPDFTGHAEELAGSVVDIAVDTGHTDEEDEFFLLPEEATKEIEGREATGQSPLQYEKISERSAGNILGADNYNSENRINFLNESVASSTGAEVQEILQATNEVDATGETDQLDRVSDLKETSDHITSEAAKMDLNQTERPQSYTTSTQYEEEDFGMTHSKEESNPNAEQTVKVTSAKVKGADESSDIKSIIEKYQTIKKLVESEEVPERPTSAMSSSGTQYEDLPVVDTRKCNSSAGSGGALKKDTVLDQSFDISLSESFTGSEMKDEAIETDMIVYSDELERLRRERQRILDMLAKDIMPSKLQVELAEAQLNYIIGQTDILLNTIDEPMDWDIQALSQHSSYPEEELGEISKEYLTRYRHSLEMSKKHIDMKIVELEKKKERTERARKRTKQFAKMRREAAIEAFMLERQREQSTFDRTIRSVKGRTPSDSPVGRSNSEPQSQRSGAMSTKVLTPMQRKQHLTNLRKGLVKYTDQERSRSVSPLSSVPSSPRSRSANSITSHSYSNTESTYSPYRSTYLAQYDPQTTVQSPRSSSLGSASLRDVSPRGTSLYSTNIGGMRDLSPRGAYGGITPRSRTLSGGFSLYGDSDTMSIGSLDEDTQRLLGDVQQVRGRTSQEIQKAKKVLEKKSPAQSPRPSHISPARGHYLHYTHGDVHGIVSSAATAADIDRRAQNRIDRIEQRDVRAPYSRASPLVLSTPTSNDKQIDQEIEELKKKYGMMSRETTAPSNYTASYMDRYTRSPVPGVNRRPGFTTYTSRVTQSSYDPRSHSHRMDMVSPSVFNTGTPSLPPYSQSSVFGRSDSSQKFRPR